MILPRFCKKTWNLPDILAQIDCFTSPTKNPSRLSATIRRFQTSTSATARTIAQGAIFDYLYSTRSLRVTDAEYISKNSPRFLGKLLSEVGKSEKDLAQSLAKYLMYHPINEFELFLESLGLNPNQYSSFLQQKKSVFLVDGDKGLLQNFQVLADYGVPRRQIGKVFTEGIEVFRYDNGVLASKLQGYEKLGLSRGIVIKLVTSCPSLLIGDVDCHFVRFFEKLNALGVGSDWICRYLKPKGLYNWRRMLQTVNLLEKIGCNEKQLQNLLERDITIVFEGSGEKVHVVLGLLLKSGLDPKKISSLFIEFPEILSVNSAKNLRQSLLFLFEIGMAAEGCAEILSAHAKLLCLNYLKKRPKSVCKDLNIDIDQLHAIIVKDPMKLFSLAGDSKKETNTSVVKRVDPSNLLEKQAFLIRLGYVENTDEMVMALKKFRGRRDQLQERFDYLVQAGLDPKDVSTVIKRSPMVLNQKTEVLERKIDCLTSYLGYPVYSIVSFPAYLCYNVEKISKRFRMYVWLKERGAAKPNLCLSTILACSDKRFVKYFVDGHPDGPSMWESLGNVSASDQG
ncbi:Transcription termination factor MTEF18, mitochondrial [Linum perenne]